jgi:hypothetical protein
MYLVTSTSKFEYTSNSLDDGMMNPPTSNEGQISEINSGSKAIMICAGFHKDTSNSRA